MTTFLFTSAHACPLMLLMLNACALPINAAQSSNPNNADLYSAPEMAAIQFKQGAPLSGSSLESALHDADFYMQSLYRDVDIIKRNPQIRFEIIGFTDSSECSTVQCESLSAYRAQIVYDWLRSKGVPSASLKGPIGRGSAMPLDKGDTEEGRAKNRRVEINLSPD